MLSLSTTILVGSSAIGPLRSAFLVLSWIADVGHDADTTPAYATTRTRMLDPGGVASAFLWRVVFGAYTSGTRTATAYNGGAGAMAICVAGNCTSS